MPMEERKMNEDTSPVKHRSLPKLGLVVAAIIAIIAIVVGVKTMSADTNADEYRGFMQAIEDYK